ncbi:type 1 glutamine amidotransferase [Streptomyces coelicoflavus]|uniref:Type 1 glutamine amidotransferase n=1 Tax=Streptomyces coelicoflavus TaxID=285562 RepID=A0A6N9UN45_9ACTN|nr:type 1 glutamine amidotransferase [Streptomyces coelicoflavus]EHN78117.1 amino transferase [Streptomyces coelicoflavus ZG0656]KPC76298.1 aminotransferase [Streptomyces sp. NRRL WC-3753]MZE41846.1 type 1 glutamine amidotransferase [Streptomyces sp. SID5477]NEB19291.1 type 1 glutamine amidotransferase [Streptomyces coelicoflavus]
MSRLLVVQNHRGGGPGRFGDWLRADGVSTDVVHAYAGAPLPRRPGHDGVLVLGGGYLPDDDVRAPWLAPTRALVARAVERGVPVFGICLGGQLLALVAGGTVRGAHGEPEVGSTPLTLRPEAGDDPLFRGLPERVTAVEHHVDAVTALPPGATWLMASERCPYQAFRVGERAWGVQFHPEAGADRVRSWDAGRLRARGLDPVELSRRAELDEPAAGAVWREVARRFAAVVAGS